MSEQEIVVWVVKYRDRPHYMMRYVDPVTGRQHARSTGTNVKREAERCAAKWEEELRCGRYRRPSRTSWDEFRERYEKEKGASLAENSLNTTITAFNHIERVIGPERLNSLTSSVLSRFQAKLREEGMKATTISTYLRHLRAAFSWAVSVVKVRPRDADAWTYHLNGLWLSGLRLDESLHLSWETDESFAVDLTGRHPRFRIYAEAEKGRQDRLLPMTPDFAEYLLQTPDHQRTGYVFKLQGIRAGEQMTSGRAGRIISEVGELAEVLVNKAEGKFASAHDLRRSFGTRWAPRVKPATLQLLMRHKAIETTMKYYVSQNADDVADELWSEYGDATSSKAS